MRERVLVVGLVLLGLAALAGVGLGLEGLRAPRPAASGAVGELSVYAQTVEGPHPLTAGREAVLPRPQSFAFQLEAAGTGPRLVRLAVEVDGARTPLHEAKLMAPARQRSLDYVARFGERAPDRLALVVTVEAPFAAPRVRRYPIRLVTASHRFWDPATRTATRAK